LRKDIHNVSVRSFTHYVKISISCVKRVISWDLRGREIPRHLACPRSERDVSESAMLLIRPLRRVRKNHGLGTSCAAFQGKPGLWYLTACGFSLIGQINSRSLFLFTRKLKFSDVRFVCSFQNVQVNKARRSILNLHHFVNAIGCILFRILRRDIRLKIHTNLQYSSFDSHYAYIVLFPTGVYT